MDAIRSGIIGAGSIGTVHARAVHAAGGRLVSVAHSSAEGASKAATRLGSERWANSYEQLIAADDIDVVHICTPNDLHLPMALAALAHGKHVICEKPLATDLSGARQLAAAAADAGVVAAVPFVYRFYPILREARELVRRGAIGDVRLVHGAYLQDWLAGADDYDWRVDATRGGSSRAFGDIGVHWCDLVEFVSGHRIVKLLAETDTTHTHRGSADEVRTVDTEDAVALTFRTDRGALGSMLVSQISQGYKNRLTFSIDGAQSSAVFDQESPDSLWVGSRDRASVVPRGSAATSEAARRLDVLPSGHPHGYQDCFNGFVGDVYAAIRGDVPDGLPTFADGLRAAEITDAVLTSATDGAWVALP